MNVTAELLLSAILKYGPTIVPLVQKLVADIKAGRGNQVVTVEDLAELNRLAGLTSDEIFTGAGVKPPTR